MNDNTIEIYLPKFLKPLLIDIEDRNLVVSYKWRLVGTKNGSIQGNKAIEYNGLYTRYLPRAIMKAPEGMDVDHKNGDIFDNRKENLRICTRTQNRINSKPKKIAITKNHTKRYSEFKGVTKDSLSTYRARIVHKGKKLSLGTYELEIEAALAYDKKAKELYGEFAWLNFPLEPLLLNNLCP
jgi:hypothetical protein